MTTVVSGQRPLAIYVETGCLSDPVTLDLANVDRCQLDGVVLNGDTLDISLDAGWSAQELVDAVNAARPDSLAIVSGAIVETPGRSRSNMQLICVDVDFEENFGTQTSRQINPLGPAHSGASTSYNYDSSGDLAANNTYHISRVIDNRPGTRFLKMGRGNQAEPEWPTDALGNYNGNAIMFNGSATPGEFYTQTATGLTIGQEYQFRLFYASLTGDDNVGPTPDAEPNPASAPNITLRIIDGVGLGGEEIASENTGFVPHDSTWHTIDVKFIARSEEITYTASNSSTVLPSNDLALDQITFSRVRRQDLTFEQRGDQETVEIVKRIREDGQIEDIRVFNAEGTVEYQVPDVDGRILGTGDCPVSASDFIIDDQSLDEVSAFGQRYGGTTAVANLPGRIHRLVVSVDVGQVNVNGMTIDAGETYEWDAPADRFLAGSGFSIAGVAANADYTVHGETSQ